jgi:hypothetical protein
MQGDTVATLVWVGLILCYAWSVWNLVRQGRRPPPSDAGTEGVRIIVGTGQRSGNIPAVAASEPKNTSRRQASGSST